MDHGEAAFATSLMSSQSLRHRLLGLEDGEDSAILPPELFSSLSAKTGPQLHPLQAWAFVFTHKSLLLLSAFALATQSTPLMGLVLLVGSQATKWEFMQ